MAVKKKSKARRAVSNSYSAAIRQKELQSERLEARQAQLARERRQIIKSQKGPRKLKKKK